MVQVIFFEKPGCINNTRQKKLLRHAGHNVIAIDLIKYEWSSSLLLNYFSALPVPDWFNKSAPKIKSGEIIPDNLTRQQAIELILEDPVLIRRPLLKSGNQYKVGFDYEEVNQWIGLNGNITEYGTDLELCTRNNKADEVEMSEE